MIRLIPFVYNSEIAYPVELGEYYAAFFYDSELLNGDGAPITTPYAGADINQIQTRQIADTMWMVHGSYPPAKLTRTTATTFAHNDIVFKYGPFLTRNDIENDDDVTMTYTGTTTTGAIGALVASSAYFDASHVGALFLIVQPKTLIKMTKDATEATSDYIPVKGAYNFVTSGAWAGTVSLLRRRGSTGTGDTFKTYTGGTVGARNIQLSKIESEYGIEMAIKVEDTTPNMTSGTNGFTANLELTDTYNNGIVRITAVTNSTTAVCEVVQPIATSAASTLRWAEGAWSDVQGYPTSVCFYGDRCIYATGRMVYFSAVGDYENFDVGVNDSDAFTVALASTNEILWLDTVDEVIVAGTSGIPWTIQSNKVGTPLTPTNYTAREQAGFGSAHIQGVKVNNAILFVDTVAKKLMEFAYNAQEGKYATPDLTVLAEHLTKDSTIVGMAHQKNPESTLWVWLADGDCLSLTYNREQNVIAWSKHPTDGDVISMCVIPSTGEDEVWLAVERNLNSINTICIERFVPRRLPTSLEDAFFVDCGITYDGTPTTSITGLDHLEGELVSILADGVVLTPQTVSGGGITLTTPASVVQAGLPYAHKVSPMRMDINTASGTTHGSIKKIPELVLSLLDSTHVEYGDSATALHDIDLTTPELVNASTINGLFTGDVTVHQDGGFSTDDSIIVAGSDPVPCTVRAIIARMEVVGR